MAKNKIEDFRNVTSIRLNHAERLLLEKLSSREKLSKSEYLRSLLNNKKRVFTLSNEQVDFLKKEFGKLGKINSNINQIAFHMNLDVLNSKEPDKNLIELKSLYEDTINNIVLLQDRIAELIKVKTN